MKFLFNFPRPWKRQKVDPLWPCSPEYTKSRKELWGMLELSRPNDDVNLPTKDEVCSKINELECMLADFYGIKRETAEEWVTTLTPQQIDNRLFWHDAGWFVVAAALGVVCMIGVLAL